MPIALSTESRENRMMPRSPEFYQFTDTFSRPAQLFPIAHADTTAQPMIQFDDIVIFHSDTEVIHPSLSVGTDFPAPVAGPCFGMLIL